MGKTGRKNNLQSQTNVVRILPLNAVFSLLSYLLSLPMLSIAVNAPILSTNLGGPEDSKVSQQFWLENNEKNFYHVLFPESDAGFLSIFSIIVSVPLRILYPLL